MVNVSAVLLSVMALLGPKSLGASDTRTLYLLTNNLIAAGAMGLALFTGAFATVIIRTGVLPRAIGWIGALIALVFLAAGGGIASTKDVFFYLGFGAFLAFSLWTLVVSVLMFRAPSRTTRRRQRRSATAARVARAGNDSGRTPSASLTAFHVAAATAANTASDARGSGAPGSSTSSTTIGGVSFARRIPNERMVRACTSPVAGSTASPSVSTQPSAMCTAPIA